MPPNRRNTAEVPPPRREAPAPTRREEEPPPIEDAPAPPAGPTYKLVYTIIERGSGRPAHWLRVGIAFINRDGSLNVRLDALPVTGTLHIRDPKPEEGEN